MSKKIRLFCVALVVFVVVLMAFAGSALAEYGLHSNVVGSDHDVTRNIVGKNPCENCHTPHAADGVYLWSVPYVNASAPQNATTKTTVFINAQGLPTKNNTGTTVVVGDGSTTAIKPLCYSCHDGTIDVTGDALGAPGRDTVFDPTMASHLTKAADTVRTSGSSAGKVYGPGRDCDLCHDPHEGDRPNFIRYKRITVIDPTTTTVTLAGGSTTTTAPLTIIGDGNNAGGDVCASCHSTQAKSSYAVTTTSIVTTTGGGTTSTSIVKDNNWIRHNHPVDVLASGSGNIINLNPTTTTVVGGSTSTTLGTYRKVLGLPGTTPVDFTFKLAPTQNDPWWGTRLFDNANNHVATGTATGYINCETCHSPHGAYNEATVTVSTDALGAAVPGTYSGAWMLNTMSIGNSSLCKNCHT